MDQQLVKDKVHPGFSLGVVSNSDSQVVIRICSDGERNRDRLGFDGLRSKILVKLVPFCSAANQILDYVDPGNSSWRVRGARLDLVVQHVAKADNMCFHSVQFYRDDHTLFATVAAFIVDGLSRGEPAVIIAAPSHRSGILASLAQAVDVAALEHGGRLIVRDADEVLASFMVCDMPDEALFIQRLTPFIETLSGVERRMIHAYGEMVNLLWQRGLPSAALALEVCWNKLAGRHALTLLCSYTLEASYDNGAFESICGLHSHIITTSGGARVPL
jgi:hypothetical protein